MRATRYMELIYIPLCFYFIYLVSAGHRHWSPIYIPLCFYFILRRTGISSGTTRIYIPLCFYFIAVHAGAGNGDQPFTFHYASTLSDLRRRLSPAAVGIYIPLCFYFIDWTIDNRTLWKPIYIPLCFYFIGYLRQLKRQGSSFTFHYASTLSLEAVRCTEMELHLHSTMLLLYRQLQFKESSRSSIYIPLCFYFIQAHTGPSGS